MIISSIDESTPLFLDCVVEVRGRGIKGISRFRRAQKERPL